MGKFRLKSIFNTSLRCCLSFVGWRLGPTEGVTECPHDSGAASGTSSFHSEAGRTWCLEHSDEMYLRSQPESECLSTPSASRAQTKKWHHSPSPWSSHGKNYWVIIKFCLFKTATACLIVSSCVDGPQRQLCWYWLLRFGPFLIVPQFTMHKLVVIMAWTIIFSKSMAIYIVERGDLGLGL